MIVVVDYGMGNLRSVEKALEKVGADVVISRDSEQIRTADHLVLPGVGAFPECMKNLTGLKLVQPIREFIGSGKPFLGICLGLQLLFDESDEFGLHEGLGIIPGRVTAFDRGMNLKIPHMGWNSINVRKNVPIFADVDNESFVYFVHSYYVIPTHIEDAATTTNYGVDFVSSVARDNIFAVQFHPEKSQDIGLKILKNFASL
jgi:glutamine amidotransferase